MYEVYLAGLLLYAIGSLKIVCYFSIPTRTNDIQDAYYMENLCNAFQVQVFLMGSLSRHNCHSICNKNKLITSKVNYNRENYFNSKLGLARLDEVWFVRRDVKVSKKV